jgi:lactate 2-monooxygenase
MEMGIAGPNTISADLSASSLLPFIIMFSPFPLLLPFKFFGTRSGRPRNNDVTLSVLRRAKASGLNALVATLLLGWGPHDLDTGYLSFAAGVGIKVGRSDPVFMQRQQLPPRPDERPTFPFDLDAFRARLAMGEEHTRGVFTLGTGWLREANSGCFRSWEDLAFIRVNWDGPTVVKGIHTIGDAHTAMDAHTV